MNRTMARKTPPSAAAPDGNPWPARLKALRGALTQKAMADRLRVSLRTYTNWEHGRKPVPGPVQLLIELLEAQQKSAN